jgi:hypothetical protein
VRHVCILSLNQQSIERSQHVRNTWPVERYGVAAQQSERALGMHVTPALQSGMRGSQSSPPERVSLQMHISASETSSPLERAVWHACMIPARRAGMVVASSHRDGHMALPACRAYMVW